MENFTPISAFFGGGLIGLAAFTLFYFNRQICGISGIVEGLLPPLPADVAWRLWLVLGLLTGGFILFFLYPEAFEFTIQEPLSLMFLGGLLVGVGTRLGKGCTSGHGVCGIGRLSRRSLVATIIFFVTAVVTATLRSIL
jgi:uncharacterized membrane protein YedE/YeeE